MGKYGSKEIVWNRFDGGLVLGVDSTELDDDQAAICANVDFRDFGLNVRRGKTVFASAAVAAKVLGLHRHYPVGGTAVLLAKAGTVIYENDGTTLSSTVTDVTGTDPYDFIGWKEWVYGGSLAASMRKRSSAGTWSLVTPVTPPTGLELIPYTPVLENFDNKDEHASDPTLGWVWNTNADSEMSEDPEEFLEGAASLKLKFQMGSVGDHVTKRFSYAPAVDLSRAESLAVWYQATGPSSEVGGGGRTMQIGIAPNNPAAQIVLGGDIDENDTTVQVTSTDGYEVGDYISIASTGSPPGTDFEIMKITGVDTGTDTLNIERAQFTTTARDHAENAVVNQAVDWSKSTEFVTEASGTWVLLRIPLDTIPPARRTAASAIGVRLVSKGKTALPFTLKLDRLLARGPLIPDHYRYSVSYAIAERLNHMDVVTQESNPFTTSLLQIEPDPPSLGVRLEASGTPDTGVNVVRFWRYRDQGPFRSGRLIGTAPVATTALNDADHISTTDTEIVVDSVLGYSPGCVLLIGSEEMLVREVDGATHTLTVVRGFGGTPAATHNDNAPVTCSYFLDQISDGELAFEDAEELSDGRIAPPKAATYALANGSLYAGNVTLDSGPGTTVNHPWRIYKSRSFFPDEFRQVQDPKDAANSAGWIDLPTKDYIRRLVEFDGGLLIFTDRSIWSLEGSGWDDFSVRKRADVGLDAREAVAVTDRLIYFLSSDGVRVVAPNRTGDDLFPCWVISEPVDPLVRAIPIAYRANAAAGVDERGRIHFSITRSGETVNDATLVFDPHAGGLGEQAYNPKRRGWTYFTQLGFSCYTTLKSGGDAGQLVGGSAEAVTAVNYIQRSSADEDLHHDGATTLTGGISDSATTLSMAATFTVRKGHVLQIGDEQLLVTAVAYEVLTAPDPDQVQENLTVTRGHNGTTGAAHLDGAAVTVLIPWSWQSKTLDAGPGAVLEWVFANANCDAAANQSITLTPVLDGEASATAYPLPLGSAASGFVSTETRFAPSIRGRHGAVKLSGVAGVPLRARDLRLGVNSRGS